MKLAIVGATGRTGQHLVREALAAGHEVVAFARSPAKLELEHDRLSVVQGDVADGERVAGAIAGADAVLSVLGPADNKPDLKVNRGMANILAAMERHGVRRLVQSIGAGVPDPHDTPRPADRSIRLLVRTLSRNVYQDMAQVDRLVRASDLDWTIVRVPRLTDEPRSSRLRVGYVGQGVGTRLSRADLAEFMLRQAEDPTYLRQAPAISN